VSDGVWWDHAVMTPHRDVNVATGAGEVQN
jgi:hypothetical protein